MMQQERDTGAYKTPNLQALDAELDRRIEAVLERKLADPTFQKRLRRMLARKIDLDVYPTMNEER